MKRFSPIVLIAALLVATASSIATADEAVEQSFDRNKGAIYALYARALRDNPKLSGKVVFEIGIGTGGEVTACRIKSSELNDPDFEAKLVARIKLFRFPPRETPTTVLKSIELFPAA